jgi:ABC-type lipoprotein export system ATPase subunit
MSVEGNILSILETQRMSRADRQARLDQLLTELNITHVAKSKGYQLSGGEARRASLVRALINKPEILLADEPTGDLDEVTEGQVMDLLGKVHQDTGATLVLITHNDELAKRAHRQFRMTGGCFNEITHR